MAESYEKAGVNLEAGYEVVRRIKSHVASTSRPGVMGNIGSFGGMFDLSALNIKEPVLVSGTDGVGTKLKLAFEMDKHDTIGIEMSRRKWSPSFPVWRRVAVRPDVRLSAVRRQRCQACMPTGNMT